MQRDERGRTRRVRAHRWTLHVELVRDARGKVAKAVARDEGRRDAVAVRVLQLEVLPVHAAHEDARIHADAPLPRLEGCDVLKK